MRTVRFDTAGWGAGALLMGLGACHQPSDPKPSPVEPPAPTVAAPPGAPEAAPVAATVAVAVAAEQEPELAAMNVAQPVSSKLGVPVDLRYRFDATVQPGQPVTMHLAAVPRVQGRNLAVRIKEAAGLRLSSGDLTVQKANVATSYRQQVSVTRLSSGPAEVRVLVTMDLPEGSAFSYYSVPLGAPVAAPKEAPPKVE